MGTDIHLVAEARDDRGKWQLIPGPIVTCSSCQGEGVYSASNHPWHAKDGITSDWGREHFGKPCEECTSPVRHPGESYEYPNDYYCGEPGRTRVGWFDNRNYNVFAILADVRNGTGFAGCKTSDGFNIIAEPRGFPDDSEEEGNEMSDASYLWFRHHGGDHTPSWVGLDEIMAFDWDQIVTKDGCVDAQNYQTWLRTGEPEDWSGDVSGGMVRHVDHAGMDAAILAGDTDHVYTRVRWNKRYREVTGDFLDRMKMLAEVCGEHPARLIFNFDS